MASAAYHRTWKANCLKDPTCRDKEMSRRKKYYARTRDKQLVRGVSIRENFLMEFKDGKACIMCGEDFSDCLDFHHRDPSQKEFALSKAYSRSREATLEEISKCDILCKKCHAKRHAMEREGITFA